MADPEPKTLEQLKDEMDAAEAAHAEALVAYKDARYARRAADAAYRAAHKAQGDDAYRACEAKRAYHKALDAQEKTDD